MKQWIQTLFLFEEDATWGEIFRFAALSAVGFIVFWAVLYFTILLWG